MLNTIAKVRQLRWASSLILLTYLGMFLTPVTCRKPLCFTMTSVVHPSRASLLAGLFDKIQNDENLNLTLLQSISRAGSVSDDDEVEEESDDQDDDDEEVEEDQEESSLSKATQASLEKIKKQKRENVKEVIQASLPSSKKKKTKKSRSSSFPSSSVSIPYIFKALLNPFTVWAMTKGYFASLFNIDYIQEDASQTLRSALQEKAKQDALNGTGGKRRPTRKFKPGQAKTLSDLPQLNT